MPSPSAGPPPVRVRRTIAALLALVAAVGLWSFGGAPQIGWAKKASPMQKAFDAALDARKPDIVNCVMSFGINQGASSVRLDIKVLVNRSGQPFGVDLQVSQQGGDQNAMSECVKRALALTRFPASKSALTEMRRQWTFATQ